MPVEMDMDVKRGCCSWGGGVGGGSRRSVRASEASERTKLLGGSTASSHGSDSVCFENIPHFSNKNMPDGSRF